MALGGNFSTAAAWQAGQRMAEAGRFAAPRSPDAFGPLAAPAAGEEGAAVSGRFGTGTAFSQSGERTFLPEALSGTFSFLPHSGQVNTINHLSLLHALGDVVRFGS